MTKRQMNDTVKLGRDNADKLHRYQDFCTMQYRSAQKQATDNSSSVFVPSRCLDWIN